MTYGLSSSLHACEKHVSDGRVQSLESHMACMVTAHQAAAIVVRASRMIANSTLSCLPFFPFVFPLLCYVFCSHFGLSVLCV